ncbi:MAG: DUF3467 domain-containing protein [Synergistales bacterium]|jgi:hypothetical protein|nr:DUF3467 domain-containing protein [Bacteroidales bacterium]MDY6435025.1 DUF3467 domain-containing protein [Synergistales bacterium]MBQ6754535.1 DUF3467 domain-containing protein [Bacteroidales bacterium]MDY6381421.1 DUF3467 domain-containing protein [Bacteroidales bacterium]MDY6393251.1 DUF3467 domain-containing protein [Bacteroidales bacterium]
MEEKREQKLDIELNAEIAQGVYSNFQIVQHSPSEFVVDFLQVMPGVPKAQVRSRIILAPMHAKKLLYALQDNISRYEKTNGKITDNTENNYTIINPLGQA